MESMTVRLQSNPLRMDVQPMALAWAVAPRVVSVQAGQAFDSPSVKAPAVDEVVVNVAANEPLPNAMSAERKMQIFGASTGITAAAMIALNFALSPWGWVLFVLSDLIWIAFAIKRRIPGQLVMYTAHMVIASVGIYRSLLPMLLA
jgi:hypothetical protein